MSIPFWKMHGAGNDFIFITALDGQPSPAATQIAEWCRRRTGIGADGLIRLCPPLAGGHFRMQIFNSDGSEAEMCGNGARCAARLAFDQDLAPAAMTIETPSGLLNADVLDGGSVRLELPPPAAWRLDGELEAITAHPAVRYAFANTGVPHAVIECDDLDRTDVCTLGAAVRHHRAFAPHGTNVDFITVTSPDTLCIRTYERGVEGETPACGTGVAAAAVTAVLRHRVTSPVTVCTAGGDRLVVAVEVCNNAPGRITLTGPARYAFTGLLARTDTGKERT